jgi:plasmid stability protein
MSNVQVKNIPEDVHELLRTRAAQHGATISDYVLELIRRDLRGPSRREWIEGVLASPKLNTGTAVVLASIDHGRQQRPER